MGRCVMVIGVQRSGTSCVAGVLHRLGVNMGEGYFQQGDKNNQKGYWEDRRWQKINKDISGNYPAGLYYDVRQPKSIGPKQLARYKALIDECKDQPIWGFKNTRSCFTAQFFWPFLEDVRLVVTQRDPEHSARSIKEHSRVSHRGRLAMTIQEARVHTEVFRAALQQRLQAFKGPVHTVNYRRLIATNKIEEVQALADFCFEGLDITPTEAQFKAARKSLYERMDHYG